MVLAYNTFCTEILKAVLKCLHNKYLLGSENSSDAFLKQMALNMKGLVVRDRALSGY